MNPLLIPRLGLLKLHQRKARVIDTLRTTIARTEDPYTGEFASALLIDLVRIPKKLLSVRMIKIIQRYCYFDCRCGLPATRVVGITGYCDTHRADAEDARRRLDETVYEPGALERKKIRRENRNAYGSRDSLHLCKRQRRGRG